MFGHLKKNRLRYGRVFGLLVLVGGLYGAAHASGLAQSFSVEGAREVIESAGVWGVFVFLLLFIVGDLLHVPGLIFVAGLVLAYGGVSGGVLGYAGALLGQSLNFWLIRTIGGRPLAQGERPLLGRLLSQLESRPLRTVIVLRLVFVLWPAVNYGLAMSSLRYRDYLLASAVGLVVPMGLFAWGVEWLLR